MIQWRRGSCGTIRRFVRQRSDKNTHGYCGMMSKSEEYRFKAAQCLESAPKVADPLARHTLLDMAAHWARLAEFHEASRDLEDLAHLVAARWKAAKLT
jgi:hypothetical protein